MNSSEQPSSGNQSSHGPEQVQTEGVFQSPPPPPVYGYAPGGGGERHHRGIFWILGKVIGVIGVAAFFVAVGYYGAMATVLTGSGDGVTRQVYQSGNREQAIAIIPVEGMINWENAAMMRRYVDAAVNNDKVKAVVLRVDSGGGFIGPSEQMHHQLERLAKSGKPIVASYGSLAASGAYYTTCQADYIYAQPVCVTGSIGVIAQAVTVEKWLADKGIQPIVLTARTAADKDTANTLLRQWTEKDKETMRDQLDAMHARFIEIVRAGRVKDGTMTEQQLGEVTTGKSYLAEDAVANKLVDEVGYLEDAIGEARSRAQITVAEPMVIEYGPPVPVLEQMGLISGGSAGGVSVNVSELDGERIRQTLMELATPRMMYLYRP